MIRRTEWRPFLDLLSPSFFDVVPAKPLLTELWQMVARYRSPVELERAMTHRRDSLARSGLPIRIVTALPKVDVGHASARERGQHVLELYFHQIFDDGVALLDLRSTRFSQSSSWILWSPSGVLADWNAEFRDAVRALYRGFFRADDVCFRQGLSALGLAKAEDAIRAQFGEGQQRAVRFSLRDFQRRFQDVFVRCQETGSRIDAGFLPLGLYLATLYEHLEALGEPFDARAAFEAVDLSHAV